MRSAVHTVLCWLGFAIPLLFCACHGQQRQQMLALLDEADSLNRAYAQLPSDTLLLEAADFFDRHGSSNERLRAHYLLGCAYRDMGDAPRAIDSFLDAAACADTTAANCDFRRLGCVYSQMADVYYQQLLLSEEIEARKLARHYALLANDTLGAITALKLSAASYILLNKPDSAETILKKALRQYKECGFFQEGLKASTMLMSVYAKNPQRHNDLKQLIDRFEANCASFDNRHELPPSKRIFYYYKGKYFENSGQLDSAEYYYRKIYRPEMSFAAMNPMYKGLLSVFQKRHEGDFIAKYAMLYCMVNDSSVAVKDQEITAQMAASYNYSLYQKQAVENAEKAKYRLAYAFALALVACLAIIVTLFLRHRHQAVMKEKQNIISQLKTELSDTENVLREKLSELQRRETEHKHTVGTINERLRNTKDKLSDMSKRYKELEKEHSVSKDIIESLNTRYESEKEKLIAEIKENEDKVKALKRQMAFFETKKSLESFYNVGIISRIMNIYSKDAFRRLESADLDQMRKVFDEYYPDFISDLNSAKGISSLGQHVCMLVALNLPSNAIVHLLGISSAQVANLKKDVNKALFGEDTAKTIYKNLVSRYNFLSF